MGLDTFETEGPRTWTDKSGRQQTLEGNTISEFEDEWGKPLHEAAQDNEFISERIREANTLGDICDMFMWLEHTVISRVAELVESGDLEVSDVPEVTHPAYNDHDVEWYIEQRNSNNVLGSSSSSSSRSSSSNNDSSNTGGALDAYRT